MQQRMRDLMGQRCRLRRHIGLGRANLNLVSVGRASGAVQFALLNEPNRDAARLGESEQTRQHVLTTFANRLGWQLRQWRAVSLRDVEHVNDLEPYAARFLVAAIFPLPFIPEE